MTIKGDSCGATRGAVIRLAETDERLNNLIIIVERYISERRN
jgi:hypothetical protein